MALFLAFAAESPQVALWREQLKLSEETLKITNTQIAELEKLMASYKNNPLLKNNPSIQKQMVLSEVSLGIYRESEKKAREANAELQKKINDFKSSSVRNSVADKEATKSLGFYRKLRSLINRLFGLF